MRSWFLQYDTEAKDDGLEIYRFWKEVPKRLLNTGCVSQGISSLPGVWSCDVDPELVERLKKRGCHADLIDLNRRTPYQDDFFDAIYSFGVLEHLHRPDVAMAEFHRILRKGGRLVVVVPSIYKMKERFWDSFQHFSPMGPFRLKAMAYIAGFDDYRVRDYPAKFPGMHILARRTSPAFVVRLQNILYEFYIRSREDIYLEAVK